MLSNEEEFKFKSDQRKKDPCSTGCNKVDKSQCIMSKVI